MIFEVGQKVRPLQNPKYEATVALVKGNRFVYERSDGEIFVAESKYWEPIPEEPAAPVFQFGDKVICEGRHGEGWGLFIKYDSQHPQCLVYHRGELQPGWYPKASLRLLPQEQKPDLYEWMPPVERLEMMLRFADEGSTTRGGLVSCFLSECIKRRSGQ